MKKDFSIITPEISKLSQKCEMNNIIDKDLYKKFGWNF